MTRLEKICNLEFAEKFLMENIDVDELLEKLVLKANKEAPKIKSLEQLEGRAIEKDNIALLKQCPMVPIINAIKERNFQKTGKREFPKFYNKLVKRYIEKYPDEAAILHPFCIVHQAMREIIGASKDILVRQIACKSVDGKIAISKRGKKLANLTDNEIKTMLKDNACIYLNKHFIHSDNK